MEQNTPPCDHTSVGILVFHEKQILLIDRKKPPFGLAAPAGHVDDHGAAEMSEPGRYIAAAKDELREEVGLQAEELELIAEGRKNNVCRRSDGTWHYWRIYKAKGRGEVNPSESETKGYVWCDGDQMRDLLAGESIVLHGKQARLEPAWRDWFAELNILNYL